MKLRNIIFLSAMLIIASFVISPLTASASKTIYGNCRTSKWGVTTRANFAAHYVYTDKNRYFIYRYAAKVHAWGRGARVQKKARVLIGYWKHRMFVPTFKGWKARNLAFWVQRGGAIKATMGIDYYRGKSKKRMRCGTWMRTHKG